MEFTEIKTIPEGVTWHCPPQYQGQIVLTFFGITDEDDHFIYAKQIDQSDGEVTYYRRAILAGDEFDFWNAPPDGW